MHGRPARHVETSLLRALVKNDVIAKGQSVLEPARAKELARQSQHDAPERQPDNPRVQVPVGALLRHAVHQSPIHV